ncbi:amidase family protein [Paraburkholderia sp. A1RI_3L]|uniref:amidase family protein n=1 Tax=Paraburkholderia TaxID=1822464 RepID=UPI003B7EFA27
MRNLERHRDRSEHDEPRNELPQRHRVPAGVRDRPAHRPERRRHASGRTFGHLMERYDVLLTPTLAMLPLPPADPATVDDAQSLSEVIDRSHRFSPFTAWFNATGQPAMSVPLYWDEKGLPVGSHFAGAFGAESLLFSLAAQLERAAPWSDRRPPISVGGPTS